MFVCLLDMSSFIQEKIDICNVTTISTLSLANRVWIFNRIVEIICNCDCMYKLLLIIKFDLKLFDLFYDFMGWLEIEQWEF